MSALPPTAIKLVRRNEVTLCAKPDPLATLSNRFGLADSLASLGASMKLPRRQFLHLAAGAVALPAVSRIAGAQSYPTRPVHIVVGFPPGQAADISARLLGQWLSERLGQSFVIDNRPGAASTIATEQVVHAPPDGYTLLFVVASNYINATLKTNLPYNFIRDIEPVASTTRSPLVVVVNPSLPIKNIPDLIAYAKAHPNKLNMASGGIGNSTHLAGELFKMMTGVDMFHVPYRGSAPALTDLVSGQVQVMFDLMASSMAYIRAGQLRALAVTTAKRSEALPELPTVGDFVPGYEASTAGGIGAPKGTPANIVHTLNMQINAGLADANLRSRYAALGSEPHPGSPADFGALIAAETEKWAKVIAFAGIKPE
jgi:tripartite-type tricarboxylate transporter receptor subunit TctC